jgi:hypothetical protein
VSVHNSILWGDIPQEVVAVAAQLTITSSDLQGGGFGAENIDLEPEFISSAGYSRLLRRTSPCVDAGTGAADGVPWCPVRPYYCGFNTEIPDLGAYGGPGGSGWER